MNKPDKVDSTREESNYQTTSHEQFFELGKNGLFIFNHQGQITFIDDQLCKITGFESKEVVNQDIITFVDPQEHERLKNYLQGLIKDSGEKVYTTLQIIKKNGQRIEVSLQLRTWVFEGNTWGVGTIVDISTLRKTLSRLFEDKTIWYRLLAGKLPIGVITTDEKGNVTSANPAALEILGSPSLEATLKFNVLTLPTLRESGISATFEEVLKSDKPKSLAVEARYTSYWGKKSWIRGKVVPVMFKDSLLGSIATFDDVTTQKEQERKLRISEQQAQTAHDQIRILMDLMNHDLRQPLQVILALVEVAGREGVVSDYVQDLKSSIRKIDDIVDKANELRDLIGFPTFYQPIDLRKLVETLKNQYQKKFESENVIFKITICTEGHFQVNGTYNLIYAIRDIIESLLYRQSKGKKQIEIKLDKKTLDERPAIELKIHDNRSILSTQEITLILHPFQHLQERTDLTYLFVAPIIAKNTGNLSITSNDQGTSFTIVFPELISSSEI